MHDLARIVIVGESCSGKTTLARELAARLGAPHVDLDHLFWGPGWEPRGRAFHEDVRQATAGHRWITDGNYRHARQWFWPRATLFVWLDRPLWLVWLRCLRRSVLRCWHHEELFGGNRETWRLVFFSRESLLLWILRTHARRRREFGELAATSTVPWVVLKNNAQVRAFVERVAPADDRGTEAQGAN